MLTPMFQCHVAEEAERHIADLANMAQVPAHTFGHHDGRVRLTNLTVYVFKPDPQYWATLDDRNGKRFIATARMFCDESGTLCMDLQIRHNEYQKLGEAAKAWAKGLEKRQESESASGEFIYLHGDEYGYPDSWHRQVATIIATEIEDARLRMAKDAKMSPADAESSKVIVTDITEDNGTVHFKCNRPGESQRDNTNE